MPLFACPTSPSCGAISLRAHTYSQTYTLTPSTALTETQNVCNHMITFATDAGVNDVLKVEFLKVSPNTVINFAVGETFETSKGSTMVTAEG